MDFKRYLTNLNSINDEIMTDNKGIKEGSNLLGISIDNHLFCPKPDGSILICHPDSPYIKCIKLSNSVKPLSYKSILSIQCSPDLTHLIISLIDEICCINLRHILTANVTKDATYTIQLCSYILKLNCIKWYNQHILSGYNDESFYFISLSPSEPPTLYQIPFARLNIQSLYSYEWGVCDEADKFTLYTLSNNNKFHLICPIVPPDIYLEDGNLFYDCIEPWVKQTFVHFENNIYRSIFKQDLDYFPQSLVPKYTEEIPNKVLDFALLPTLRVFPLIIRLYDNGLIQIISTLSKPGPNKNGQLIYYILHQVEFDQLRLTRGVISRPIFSYQSIFLVLDHNNESSFYSIKIPFLEELEKREKKKIDKINPEKLPDSEAFLLFNSKHHGYVLVNRSTHGSFVIFRDKIDGHLTVNQFSIVQQNISLIGEIENKMKQSVQSDNMFKKLNDIANGTKLPKLGPINKSNNRSDYYKQLLDKMKIIEQHYLPFFQNYYDSLNDSMKQLISRSESELLGNYSERIGVLHKESVSVLEYQKYLKERINKVTERLVDLNLNSHLFTNQHSESLAKYEQLRMKAVQILHNVKTINLKANSDQLTSYLNKEKEIIDKIQLLIKLK